VALNNSREARREIFSATLAQSAKKPNMGDLQKQSKSHQDANGQQNAHQKSSPHVTKQDACHTNGHAP
jgi:hypothetical protein